MVDRSSAHGMIALQGPTVRRTSLGWSRVADIPSFGFAERRHRRRPCLVARTGYTGERGVEIVTPADGTLRSGTTCWRHGAVPCGLGARDTLRLEVCYPLHGNDITPTPTRSRPGSAGSARCRRIHRRAVLRRTKEEGPAQRLVAFRMTERAIPRGAMAILDGGGGSIGAVTSGTLSPSMDEGIGMGYVRATTPAWERRS